MILGIFTAEHKLRNELRKECDGICSYYNHTRSRVQLSSNNADMNEEQARLMTL